MGGNNLEVSEGDFEEYRDFLKKVENAQPRSCNLSDNDLALGPAGYGKTSADGKNLRAGARPDGFMDLRDWVHPPLSIRPTACQCPAGQRPILLIKRTETFYPVEGDLLESSDNKKECDVVMGGYRNYYQLVSCKAPENCPGCLPGIPDVHAECQRSGQEASANGVSVSRDSYKPPVCNSVRIIGDETRVLVAPDSCKCCGDYEYTTLTEKSFKIYAEGPGECGEGCMQNRRSAMVQGGNGLKDWCCCVDQYPELEYKQNGIERSSEKMGANPCKDFDASTCDLNSTFNCQSKNKEDFNPFFLPSMSDDLKEAVCGYMIRADIQD